MFLLQKRKLVILNISSDTGNYGFILPSDQIEPQFDEVKAGLIALFKYIKENMINE